MANRCLAQVEEQVNQRAPWKPVCNRHGVNWEAKETTREGVFSYVLFHLTASQMLRAWSVAVKSGWNDWFARLSDHSFDFMVSIMTINRQEVN